MKNTKKKGLILGITLLSALSIGYAVNSQSGENQKSKIVDSIPYAYTRNGKPFEQNVLSNNEFVTTLNASNNYGKYKFRDDRKDFDGIYAKPIEGYEPEKQLWEGLTETEKSEMTLITKNTKIKKEIKDKTTRGFLPVKGVKFCQYLGTITDEQPRPNTYDKKLPNGKTLKLDDDAQYCSEPTNENGETWLQIDDMDYGESYLVEKYIPNQIFIGSTNKHIELKQPEESIKIYVDLGVRFLGETDGIDLISYKGLREKLREGGKYIGKDLELNENDEKYGKWLKIYDIRKNKVLYIAKKPVTNSVSWQNLYLAGVVYGSDLINFQQGEYGNPMKFFPKIIKYKRNSEEKDGYLEEYKGKTIKITDNQGKERRFSIRILEGGSKIRNRKITDEYIKFTTQFAISEWNRYIIPLVGYYRNGGNSWDALQKSLKQDKESWDYARLWSSQRNEWLTYYGPKKGYKVQIANYNWFGDLTLGTERETQQYLYNGKKGTTFGKKGQSTITLYTANKSNPNARRGGESANYGAAEVNFIPISYEYDDNGFRPVLEEIPQNCYDGACFEGEVAGTDFITYKDLKNSLETPKNKIGIETELYGDEKETGGNWLKIHDYKEGKILYISKKPISYEVSWNQIYNAGAVYGLDMLNKDGTPKEPNLGFKDGILGLDEQNNTLPKDYRGKILTINDKQYLVRLLKTTKRNNPNVANLNGSHYTLEEYVGSEWNRYILPLVSIGRYGTTSQDYVEDELKAEITNEKFKVDLAQYNWREDLNNFNKGHYNWTQEYTNSTNNRSMSGRQDINSGAGAAPNNAPNFPYTIFGFRPTLEEIPE